MSVLEHTKREGVALETQAQAEGAIRMMRKRSAAMGKHTDKVEAARRIAREMGQYGPVSIDDLTEKLIAAGYDTRAVNDPKNRRLWKGGVFTTGEWVPVGLTPSKVATNNGRKVQTWALKSWLDKNPMNGTQHTGSEFDVYGILKEFEKAHPGSRREDLAWNIGDTRLSGETKFLIKQGRGLLYGIPVFYFRGAVGCTLQRLNTEIKNAISYQP